MKIYEVRNKVFSQLFADKESAEIFMASCASSTNGLEIIEKEAITLQKET